MELQGNHNQALFAQVIVDINHPNLDHIFEYSIPEAWQSSIEIGRRVLVPFGKGNKRTEGIIIGMDDSSIYDVSKIKPIAQLMDDFAVLRCEQIELAQWMTQQYGCLLVDALRLMFPAQLRGNRVQEKQARSAKLLLDQQGFENAMASIHSKNGQCKAPLQKRVLELLLCGEFLLSDIYEEVPGANAAIAAMCKKGWLEIRETPIFRKPYTGLREEFAQPPIATDEQENVVARLKEAIDAHKGAFVLRGVTGSGKTEVYMLCISHCIALGKTAIVLVPEISLTPQTVERFRNRFGKKVAVLHSRLSHGERYDEWRRIRSGNVQVAVGARSAVFAPFENLGLIVIDEEHESSYRSDKTPRYHAVDIARKRCETQGGVLLLASATPGIETWYQAEKGELEILTLSQRVNQKPLPPVETVDMREELAQGNRSMFSGLLYKRMKECYFSKRQMILFLNRRGYSTFVLCRACGHVLQCSNCDVSMTYHQTDQSVRCHYCDAQMPVPPTCPACGQTALKHFGAGTQQVEEQVLKLFPGIRTIRMDYDTTRKKDAHLKLLQAFRDKQADVLIGTQMIAKGLDFPEVTLVGVIAADATLHVPDFRNAERCFQLLTQVAGRAGRDKDDGHVVVQTYSPEHPSVKLSAKHDFESFYAYEIACRKQSEFPPFADFVRFLFSGELDAQVSHQCLEFRKELESRLQQCIDENELDKTTLLYVSSHAAPLHHLRGEFRHQLVIKFKRNESAKVLFRMINAFAREKRAQGLLPSMEINPQNMN